MDGGSCLRLVTEDVTKTKACKPPSSAFLQVLMIYCILLLCTMYIVLYCESGFLQMQHDNGWAILQFVFLSCCFVSSSWSWNMIQQGGMDLAHTRIVLATLAQVDHQSDHDIIVDEGGYSKSSTDIWQIKYLSPSSTPHLLHGSCLFRLEKMPPLMIMMMLLVIKMVLMNVVISNQNSLASDDDNGIYHICL